MYWYFIENVNSFIFMGYCNFKYEKENLKVEFEIFLLIVIFNLIIFD